MKNTHEAVIVNFPFKPPLADPKVAGKLAAEKRVIDAVGELFMGTMTAAFRIPIPGTKPTVWIIAGTVEGINHCLKELK